MDRFHIFSVLLCIPLSLSSSLLGNKDSLDTSRHGRIVLNGAKLCQDSIKLIQVIEEVEYYNTNEISASWSNKIYSLAVPRRHLQLTAIHSLWSTYFGRTTIVLKLPLIKALLTKGLQRYKGLLLPPSIAFDPGPPIWVSYGICGSVGDFFGRDERPIDRKKLDMLKKICESWRRDKEEREREVVFEVL